MSDLGRSERFYREAFGFEATSRYEEEGREFAFLARDGKLVLTPWQQSGGRFGTDRPGLHHLSFGVGSVEEVRGYEERLRGLGAGFLHEGVVPHGEGADSGACSSRTRTAYGWKSTRRAARGRPRPRPPAPCPAGSFRRTRGTAASSCAGPPGARLRKRETTPPPRAILVEE